MQFFGWLNNWPLIRLIQAPLAIIYTAAVIFGLLIFGFAIAMYFPLFGILLMACVLIGLILGTIAAVHDLKEWKHEEELQKMADPYNEHNAK